ncbi:MAG: hypothetical protein KBG47_02520 [Bacteroidia bacterium]|nr:hypothetical protein [Sphingobacteriaceae bacterium]MBP9068353.1 hypothetical protein [Bacteroidia bacterium]
MNRFLKINAFIFFCFPLLNKAQELFPNSEPASLIPKRVFGIRLMNEYYKEISEHKTWQDAMLMYGISSKFMIIGSFSFSNHHAISLPNDFILNDGNIGLHTHGNEKGGRYTYKSESVALGFRYRFFNRDGDHRHFRMALYGNAVYSNQAHDEAETNLMGDNTGAGGGVIATVLKKKLAISFTGGAVFPTPYTDKNKDITLLYGNAYNYSLSFGYLLLPFKYKSYDQTNLNFYAEFLGKNYDELKVYQNNSRILIQNVPAFEKGNYVEFRPAIQFIIKSSLRIDLSRSFTLLNRSYVRTYPAYNLNIQYYFL